MRPFKGKIVKKKISEARSLGGEKQRFDYLAAVELATQSAIARSKASEKQTVSSIVMNYVSPLMAVMGWSLLIIWYLMNLVQCGTVNSPPVINAVQPAKQKVLPGETISIQVFATDPDGNDNIHYFWGSVAGKIQLDRFEGPQCTYVAPDEPGMDLITITAYDSEGESDVGFTLITIAEGPIPPHKF